MERPKVGSRDTNKQKSKFVNMGSLNPRTTERAGMSASASDSSVYATNRNRGVQHPLYEQRLKRVREHSPSQSPIRVQRQKYDSLSRCESTRYHESRVSTFVQRNKPLYSEDRSYPRKGYINNDERKHSQIHAHRNARSANQNSPSHNRKSQFRDHFTTQRFDNQRSSKQLRVQKHSNMHSTRHSSSKAIPPMHSSPGAL